MSSILGTSREAHPNFTAAGAPNLNNGVEFSVTGRSTSHIHTRYIKNILKGLEYSLLFDYLVFAIFPVI